MGRTALVTGSTSGIGKAIALKFAENKYSVIVCGRNVQEGMKVLNRVKELSDGIFVKVDLRYKEEIDKLVESVLEHYDRVDVLVNNAGILVYKPLEEITYDEMIDSIRVNFVAPFLLMQKFLPLMKRWGGGVVINISSIAGLSPYPKGGIYCSTKAALISLSKVAALECAQYNIRVVAVAPGLVETRMLYQDAPKSEKDRFREIMASRVPIGRIANPEEIAEFIVYLASERASYITGSVHVIDGGLIAGRREAGIEKKQQFNLPRYII